ncbi:MAG: PP0621 family protein [Wolinella sp.]
MGRLILLALLAAFIYYVFIRKPKELREERGENGEKAEEIMLECDRCGVYVSKQESFIVDGKFYCSKECAQVK